MMVTATLNNSFPAMLLTKRLITSEVTNSCTDKGDQNIPYRLSPGNDSLKMISYVLVISSLLPDACCIFQDSWNYL